MSLRVGVSGRVVFSLINCVNEYGVAGRTELARGVQVVGGLTKP
jgi:hypothetical protein